MALKNVAAAHQAGIDFHRGKISQLLRNLDIYNLYYSILLAAEGRVLAPWHAQQIYNLSKNVARGLNS